MSAGISGSYTVFSAATISAVSCSSSSGGIDEPGSGAFGLSSMVVLRTRMANGEWRMEILPFAIGHSPFALSRKELVRLQQGLGEGVHLGLGIVHGERGAAGCRHAQALHQGLGAVVAGAHRHAGAVDDGGHVVWVQPVDAEGDDGALVPGVAMDPEPVELGQPLVRVVLQ